VSSQGPANYSEIRVELLMSGGDIHSSPRSDREKTTLVMFSCVFR
jgi:hypothetical protein